MKRIVIGANAHAEMGEMLGRLRPDLEVRGSRYMDVAAADLAWGEAYVGFKRPPQAHMGNIRWVHCTGAGVDGWLYPDELPGDVLLTRTSESFGPMIAEWALARALAFTQRLTELALHQREREWKPGDVRFVRGTRAIIVGTGDVGTHVGRLFRALGCEVHGVSRSGGGDTAVFESVSRVESLSAIVSRADWLIVTLPLTAETRGLIGHRVLEGCRGAVLMNAGRGPVVDESLLPRALDEGWLAGVALDVFEVEPLPPSSPLWADPRVMISPHMSGITTVAGAVEGFLACLADVERGVRPRFAVDRERGY